MQEDNKQNNKTDRRNFLRKSLITGSLLTVSAIGLEKVFSGVKNSGEKIKVLAPDGKVYEASSDHLKEYRPPPVTNAEARKGIANKKFVMVIDLAKCDGCKTCTVACQAMHYTESDREWIKVFKMQDAATTAPYFFPKPCFHCDNLPLHKGLSGECNLQEAGWHCTYWLNLLRITSGKNKNMKLNFN